MSLCGEIENLEYETSYLEHEIKELHKAYASAQSRLIRLKQVEERGCD